MNGNQLLKQLPEKSETWQQLPLTQQRVPCQIMLQYPCELTCLIGERWKQWICTPCEVASDQTADKHPYWDTATAINQDLKTVKIPFIILNMWKMPVKDCLKFWALCLKMQLLRSHIHTYRVRIINTCLQKYAMQYMFSSTANTTMKEKGGKKVSPCFSSADNQCWPTLESSCPLTGVYPETGGVEFAHVKLQPNDGKHDDGEEKQQADLKQRNHRFHYGL